MRPQTRGSYLVVGDHSSLPPHLFELSRSEAKSAEAAVPHTQGSCRQLGKQVSAAA